MKLIFEIMLCVAIIGMSIFTLIRFHKNNKDLEKYEKAVNILIKKQNIAINKKVDYDFLCKSKDYLSYNSKVNSENKKLTEEEFKALEQDYLFYTFPHVYLALEKENKDE